MCLAMHSGQYWLPSCSMTSSSCRCAPHESHSFFDFFSFTILCNLAAVIESVMIILLFIAFARVYHISPRARFLILVLSFNGHGRRAIRESSISRMTVLAGAFLDVQPCLFFPASYERKKGVDLGFYSVLGSSLLWCCLLHQAPCGCCDAH